jgi:solute carrier family 25 S-adenosylmethionine transporter 26
MEEGPRQSFDLSPKLSNARRQSATAALLGIPAWASLSTAAAAAATEPQNAVAAAHLLSQAASASASASVTVDALVGGMLAGAIAGAAVDLALYPIDTIKTRLQTIGSIQLEAGEWRQLYSGGTSALFSRRLREDQWVKSREEQRSH